VVVRNEQLAEFVWIGRYIFLGKNALLQLVGKQARILHTSIQVLKQEPAAKLVGYTIYILGEVLTRCALWLRKLVDGITKLLAASKGEIDFDFEVV
jgi:hypothetical protein